MHALSLTDQQLSELKLTASTLPLPLRAGLLELLAGYLASNRPDDAAFQCALSAALATMRPPAPAADRNKHVRV
jgi:hypothetical protein